MEHQEELNDKELQAIADILEVFDNELYQDSGVKHLNLGFASSDMYYYDEEHIDIETRIGVQGEWEEIGGCRLSRDVITKVVKGEMKPADAIKHFSK